LGLELSGREGDTSYFDVENPVVMKRHRWITTVKHQSYCTLNGLIQSLLIV